jgi:MFS family permease
VPQIRFSAREVSSDAVVMRAGVSAADVFASSAPPSSVASSSYSASGYSQDDADTSFTRRPGGLDRQTAVRSALNAGAIAAVLCLLPLGFIVAMPMAGYFGVRLYRRRSLRHEPSPGAGFRLGALCGAFGSAIFVMLAVVLTLATHAENEFRDKMIEIVRHAQAGYPESQAQPFDYFVSPHGLMVMVVASGIFFCVTFVLVSGLGGAISASLLRRKGPRG